MAVGLRYVPPIGFESLKVNDQVSKSTFGIAHNRPFANTDGTVTTFADIGIASDQISSLAEELWRNSVEGIEASLNATIHAVDDEFEGPSTLTELLKHVAYDLQAMNDTRLAGRKPACSACIDVTGEAGCSKNGMINFFAQKTLTFHIEESSADYIRIRMRYILTDTVMRERINDLRTDLGMDLEVTGVVACEGDIARLSLSNRSLDTPGELNFWLEHHSAISLGQCLSRIIVGYDTCVAVSVYMRAPSNGATMNFTLCCV